MTSRTDIEKAVRSLYAARVEGDVEKVLQDIADDATFSLNARGTGVPALAEASRGKPTIESVVKELIATWRFEDLEERSFLIDGDKAVVCVSARVTFIPTGKSDIFDIVDEFAFRDGKIVSLRQNTDTSLAMALTAA